MMPIETASPMSTPVHADALGGGPFVAFGAGPSVAGVAVVGVLATLALVGAVRSLRRRFDPRLRAETLVFDRVGLELADRRLLRRAARRLDPPVPPASLLLSASLIELARGRSSCPPEDRDRLGDLARRQFGRTPAPGRSQPGSMVEGAGPSRRPVRLRPTVDVDAATTADVVASGGDPNRMRAASMLAVALEAAAQRRG